LGFTQQIRGVLHELSPRPVRSRLDATLLSSAAAFAAEAAAVNVEELVVTGTRTEGRSRLDTLAPVDVITSEALTKQGNSTELAQALANLTPALDFPRPAITDGTDHVRPATLRGLAPDQTLVLVNGMRGHVSAPGQRQRLHRPRLDGLSTSTPSRRSPSNRWKSCATAPRLSTAPTPSPASSTSACARRAKAAARQPCTASTNTRVTTSRGSRDANDGLTESVAAWQGLPIGDKGFLTLSGEWVLRHPTNRSDYTNQTALPAYGRQIVLGRFGDPKVDSYSVYANAGVPLGDTWEAYGYAGYQHRDSNSAATARAYNNANNVPAVYPGGFLPAIETKIIDYSVQGGVKGDLAGWNVNLSANYGRNDLDYRHGELDQRLVRRGLEDRVRRRLADL
jgi:iron complex outermembrane receptor protein